MVRAAHDWRLANCGFWTGGQRAGLTLLAIVSPGLAGWSGGEASLDKGADTSSEDYYAFVPQ